MDAIRTYLAAPSGERSYTEGLKLLEEFGGMAHAVAYAALAKGPMGNNRQKLFNLLQSLPAQSPPPRAEAIEVQASKPALLTPSNASEVSLLVALRKAKQERAKCSQQFHTCNTDQERAEVCVLIEMATERIRKLEADLAKLQRYGAIEVKQEEEELPIPDDLEGLRNEQRRLNSQLLKVENTIVMLLSLPESDKRRKKLPEKEKQMRHLNARKQAVRIKIRSINIEQDETAI
jgi:hypothetical protein